MYGLVPELLPICYEGYIHVNTVCGCYNSYMYTVFKFASIWLQSSWGGKGEALPPNPPASPQIFFLLIQFYM